MLRPLPSPYLAIPAPYDSGRGGNLPNTLGLGPDGIFGSEDDVDVDFGLDRYVEVERFAGFENTLAAVSCALAGASAIFHDGFESGDLSRWSQP